MKLSGNWLKVGIWTTYPCLHLLITQDAVKARNINRYKTRSINSSEINEQPVTWNWKNTPRSMSLYTCSGIFCKYLLTDTHGDRKLVWTGQVWPFWHSQCSVSLTKYFTWPTKIERGEKKTASFIAHKKPGEVVCTHMPEPVPRLATPPVTLLGQIKYYPLLYLIFCMIGSWLKQQHLRGERTAYFWFLPPQADVRQAIYYISEWFWKCSLPAH